MRKAKVMPVRGGDCTQATDKHDCEERALNRAMFGRVFECIDGSRVENPCAVADSVCVFARVEVEARWSTICGQGGEGGDSTRTERVR